MNLTPAGIIKQLNEFWGRQSKGTKTGIIVSAVVFLAVSILAASLLNMKNYVVLYRGLSSAESGEIISRLDAMAVDSKVESDGTILVPGKDEARLKMQLSSEGYPKSTLNYDIFTNNSDFMTTDYEKKKYLLFQLQNRLQDAINTLQGVDNAIVTISVQDDTSFVLQQDEIPSTASVILDLSGNTELSKKQIKGIEELVAKSVPGLAGKNVVIVDGEGVILNSAGTEESMDQAYTKIEMQNSVSDSIKNKIISLLEPVFGKNGVSVAVNVVIDFQKKTSQEKTYTPVVDNTGIISKQEQTKETVGSAATTGGVAGTDNNTQVDTYAGGTNAGDSGSSTEASSTEYLVNELTQSVQNDGGEIVDMSVAVMINNAELSDTDLNKYKEIVAFGTGVDAEKIVVSNMEFSAVKEMKDIVSNTKASTYPLTMMIIPAAGGLVLILFTLVLLTLRKGKKKTKRAVEHRDNFPPLKSAIKSGTPPIQMPQEDLPGEIVLSETREQGLKKQIKEFSAGNPDIVAQLIRTWIKEESIDNE